MRSEYVARGKPNSFQVTSNTQSLRLWSGEVRRRASSKRSRLKRKEENFITKNRAERQHERARTPLVSCKPRASCNTRCMGCQTGACTLSLESRRDCPSENRTGRRCVQARSGCRECRGEPRTRPAGLPAFRLWRSSVPSLIRHGHTAVRVRPGPSCWPCQCIVRGVDLIRDNCNFRAD